MENIAKYIVVLYIKGVRRAIRHHRQRALKVIGGRVFEFSITDTQCALKFIGGRVLVWIILDGQSEQSMR